MVRSLAYKLFKLTHAKAIQRLPQQYLKHYEESLQPEKRIHDAPPETKYLDYNQDPQTGYIYREPDHPIPIFRPEQSQYGLWGGVGCVKGFEKPKVNKPKITRFWTPSLQRTTLYSEILDIYIDLVVTKEALKLVHHHHGLDFYILRTPVKDLHSKLGASLKHRMMVALAKKDYHHEHQDKQNYVTEKYKEFILPLEEAELYGLSVPQLIAKHKDATERGQVEPPLKQTYAEQLLAKLKLECEAAAKDGTNHQTS